MDVYTDAVESTKSCLEATHNNLKDPTHLLTFALATQAETEAEGMSAAASEGTAAAEPGKEPKSDLQTQVKGPSVTEVTAAETPTVVAAQNGMTLADQDAAEAGVRHASLISSCRSCMAHIDF